MQLRRAVRKRETMNMAEKDQQTIHEPEQQQEPPKYEAPELMAFDPPGEALGSCPASAPAPCQPGASDVIFCSTGTIQVT